MLAVIALPLWAYLLLSGRSDDDDVVAAGSSTVPASEAAVADPTQEEVDEVDEAAAVTTTAVPPTTSSTVAPPPVAPSPAPAIALPPADLSTPPVEAFGVYGGGKVTLRGSVPTEELAAAYAERAATVIGAENVIIEMTLDPRVEAQSMTIDVDEQFQFPSGSVIYDEDFEALLTLGAFALQLLPEATLVVTGHTDSIGDEATNQALSVARASLVVDFMVRGGIPRDRVVARGAGESEPIADNATLEGRQANRRIEAQVEGVRPYPDQGT